LGYSQIVSFTVFLSTAGSIGDDQSVVDFSAPWSRLFSVVYFPVSFQRGNIELENTRPLPG